MTFKDISRSLFRGAWVLMGKSAGEKRYKMIGVCNITPEHEIILTILNERYQFITASSLDNAIVHRVDAEKAIPEICIDVDESLLKG